MKLKYDIRGNLSPYSKVNLSTTDFKENLVNSYQEISTRHEIFEYYSEYIQDFQNEITPDFK